MELNQPSNTPDAVAELLTLTCEINEFGTKFYRNKEGDLHRIHGPAVIWEGGSESWYRDGQRHREDDAAAIWYDGIKEYYINGNYLTKYQFIQWQITNGIKPIE